jgi:chromosomal replication initiation ATPase DnaA
LYNACLEEGGSLLLTARQAPGSWRPVLADLGSRLRAAAAIGIDPPDDALLSAVLAKHFADRQVRVASDVIAYLVRRMERSPAAAKEIVAALDRAALSRRGAITIPLTNEVLAARPNQCLPPGSDAGVT